MRTGIEALQKLIILGSIALGVMICLGGLTYKYLTADKLVFVAKNKEAAQNFQEITSLPYADNFYAKLKLGQPVNIVVFGDDFTRIDDEVNKEVNTDNTWTSQLTGHLENNFHSKVNLKEATTLKGTSWSSLISLNNYQKTTPQVPDLILFCFGTNDQQELNIDQFKTIYEALIQTAVQSYPKAEIILVQEHLVSDEIREIQKQLATHYDLPLVDMSNAFNNGEKGYAPYATKIFDIINSRINNSVTPKKIAQVEPLFDTRKYLSWQRIESFSSAQLMDQAKVSDGAPRLVSAKNGAFVESKFTGSAVGVIVKCVPDGGLARLYVDKKRYSIINTYSPEPELKFILVADDLPTGEHTVNLRVLGQKKYPSQGTRVIWYGFDVTGQ